MHPTVLEPNAILSVIADPHGLIAWLVVATVLLVAGITLVSAGRRRLLAWIERRALDWAREIGYRPLRYDGLKKVFLGLTNIEKIEALTPVEFES